MKETLFLVADPANHRSRQSHHGVPQQWPVVREVRPKFPRQISGFIVHQDQLFQLVLTPVYAGSGRGAVLINVLVAGYTVNHLVAQELKESTGASEFVFFSRGRVFASTLNDRATAVLSARALRAGRIDLVSDGVSEYVALGRELIDLAASRSARWAFFARSKTRGKASTRYAAISCCSGSSPCRSACG
jgi:hypothetical protein